MKAFIVVLLLLGLGVFILWNRSENSPTSAQPTPIPQVDAPNEGSLAGALIDNDHSKAKDPAAEGDIVRDDSGQKNSQETAKGLTVQGAGVKPPTGPSETSASAQLNKDGLPGFLDKNEIPDLKQKLSTAHSVKDGAFLQTFQGNFEGEARPLDASRPSMKMGLQMALEIVNEKQQGRVYIEITKPKQALNYNLPIRITELMRLNEFPEAILLTAIAPDGGTTYFQIYYLRDLDSVGGNYYRESKGKLARQGTFLLERI